MALTENHNHANILSVTYSSFLYDQSPARIRIIIFETSQPEKITGINTENIRGISLPPGFAYAEDADSSYSNWLLDLKLKKK
jgi:hypothetical protein